MQIIPAIDIKDGKCVRLRQGEFSQVDTYADDPLKFALRWESEGAERLHIVDLDGARAGLPQNEDVVEQILRHISIPVQLGGGIRSMETIERMLSIGVDRVILGTSITGNDNAARSALEVYGDKIVIGIDARDGFVAISGWTEHTTETSVSFARRMAMFGAARIVFTDIARDGMLSGPNTRALAEILASVPVSVIASGGVGNLDHIRELAGMDAANLEGAIVGKALYAGTLSLPEALSAAEGMAHGSR